MVDECQCGRRFPSRRSLLIHQRMCSTNPNRKMLPGAFTPDEDALLLDLKQRGFTFPEMAERLGRTKSALSHRLLILAEQSRGKGVERPEHSTTHTRTTTHGKGTG